MDDEQSESQVLRALKRLQDKWESGEPIPCTTVRIEHTPDGPLTTRSESTLQEFIAGQQERNEGDFVD